MCREANWATPEIEEHIKYVSLEFETCAKTGPPKPSRKLSHSHVKEVFNREIQADFLVFRINEKVNQILHFVDVGTAYSE